MNDYKHRSYAKIVKSVACPLALYAAMVIVPTAIHAEEAEEPVGTETEANEAIANEMTGNEASLPSNEEALPETVVDEDSTLHVTGSDEATVTNDEDGLHVNSVGKGDYFVVTETQGSDFIFSADVEFHEKSGAASLMFRSNMFEGDAGGKIYNYVVNLSAENTVKFWRWAGPLDYQLIDEKRVDLEDTNKHNLKVIAYGPWISYFVDDILVANLGDYGLQVNDKGQPTYIPDGYFGFLTWNGNVTYRNAQFTKLEDTTVPVLEDVTVTSNEGTVDKKGQFFELEPYYIQYVDNDTKTINLSVTSRNEGTLVYAMDEAGNVYYDMKNIPVKEGKNIITVVGQKGQAEFVYRVNVHRLQPKDVYYNEEYRDQYHYSVKEGWANDPNGMVYHDGVYHLFYQFYDDTKWGPMHWAHATSTDLVHWEEQPIAFYPDGNGAMFSGCIVYDENNDSGFVPGGGFVALITADGGGQRIKLAYSKDGFEWTKVDEIAADWTNDPLGIEYGNRDFRDPKVFKWENKWFMVLAGGPLRIYSSDNLRDWTCEYANNDLHTECPDMYPIQANDGQVKWVLSRGGRFYKVGDFKVVDGKWTFVPDAEYEHSDGVMNFGKDSYAAMTYYVQNFGTEANPTLPKIIEINWMNTWDNYCNLVADTVGQKFNGTFNLNLELGLRNENGTYVLTQTPVSQYEDLRLDTTKINGTIAQVNEKLKDFQGDAYEIEATITPDASTKKVGFEVRKSDNQSTKVYYDLETGRIVLDRSNSGILLTNMFADTNSQAIRKNEDGTITLHIFVDRASVEVFTADYTAAGANQIFPGMDALGLQAFTEGGNPVIDMALHTLDTIWDKEELNRPISLNTQSPTDSRIELGEELALDAYVYPASAPQDIDWSIVDGDAYVTLKVDGDKVTVTGMDLGTATIEARSKADSSLVKTFNVKVSTDRFNTNIPEYINRGDNFAEGGGNWDIDGENLNNSTKGAINEYYLGVNEIPYKEYDFEMDISYTQGIINIFYAAPNSTNMFDQGGAYTFQLLDKEQRVRILQFGKPDDQVLQIGAIPVGMGGENTRLADGQFHHIRVEKRVDSTRVYVDDVLLIDHKYDSLEDFYNASNYVGLGIWNGTMQAKNVFVYAVDSNEVQAEDYTGVYDGQAHNVNVVTKVADSTLQYSKDQENWQDTLDVKNVSDSGVWFVKASAAYQRDVVTSFMVDIQKAPLSITTDNGTKSYDGTGIQASGSIQGLLNGETVTLRLTGSQTQVGRSVNTYELVFDGTALEENYEVVQESLGFLTVTEAEAETETKEDPKKEDVKQEKVKQEEAKQEEKTTEEKEAVSVPTQDGVNTATSTSTSFFGTLLVSSVAGTIFARKRKENE